MRDAWLLRWSNAMATLRSRIERLEAASKPQRWLVLQFFDAVTREPVQLICDGFTTLEQLVVASLSLEEGKHGDPA